MSKDGNTTVCSPPLSTFNIIKVKRLQFSFSWGSHLKPAAASSSTTCTSTATEQHIQVI